MMDHGNNILVVNDQENCNREKYPPVVVYYALLIIMFLLA